MEALISATVFGVLITLTAGLFVAAFRTEHQILQTRKVLGETTHAMEHITRALRMAIRDDEGTCIIPGTEGLNYSSGGNEITFINALQQEECQTIFLQDNRINLERGGGSVVPLTSSDVIIENLVFEVSGASKNDDLQPFVTIRFDARTKRSSVVRVQTSVSQRNLDVR